MSGLGGLSLGGNARVSGSGGVRARVGGQGPGVTQGAGPAGAGAFGQGATTGDVATLHPAAPVGLGLTVSVASVVGLVLVRHSLPSNLKRVFDLGLIEIILVHHAWGLARLESRRWAASCGPILSTIGGAGNVVFGS